MNFDPATIAAWGGLITGIAGAVIALVTSRNTARKDELDSLRQPIKSLQVENKRLSARMEEMESEIEDRDRRIKMLERRLEEQTRSREDREKRIAGLVGEGGGTPT